MAGTLQAVKAYLVPVGTLGATRGLLDDGDDGRGEYDALDLGAVLLSGLEYAESAVHSGARDFGGVLPLPDDGGGGVDDTIDVLDGVVVGTLGFDVGDDDGGDLALVFGESVDDEVALGGVADAKNASNVS